ncbi:hypothetical protein [Gracilibacillus massiliensis]|uniref:hypothetical protein n=1 Tax=Gracilibacillus massiliensis TaxID=1564956 RepID=UPI00071C7409|nr:hypothetical protein [Gracilibacillus massiliensis]
MKKKLLLIMAMVVALVGCNTGNTDTISITATPESDYRNTFEELGLGQLFDFDFILPNADTSWVTLWVEKYSDGEKEKEKEPIAELSYGMSPNKKDEGKLGFGMINPRSEDSQVFLYGPGTTLHPSKKELGLDAKSSFTWGYATEETINLEIGETKVLAGYRQATGNSIRTYGYQTEEDIERMIEEDSIVLLLKIKVERAEEKDKLE